MVTSVQHPWTPNGLTAARMSGQRQGPTVPCAAASGWTHASPMQLTGRKLGPAQLEPGEFRACDISTPPPSGLLPRLDSGCLLLTTTDLVRVIHSPPFPPRPFPLLPPSCNNILLLLFNSLDGGIRTRPKSRLWGCNSENTRRPCRCTSELNFAHLRGLHCTKPNRWIRRRSNVRLTTTKTLTPPIPRQQQ